MFSLFRTKTEGVTAVVQGNGSPKRSVRPWPFLGSATSSRPMVKPRQSCPAVFLTDISLSESIPTRAENVQHSNEHGIFGRRISKASSDTSMSSDDDSPITSPNVIMSIEPVQHDSKKQTNHTLASYGIDVTVGKY
eukprot:CFRG5551T1